MINVKNVNKTIVCKEKNKFFSKKKKKKKKIVDNVSFEISKGECVGILGLNGAGKTTLIKLMTGVLYPDEKDSIKIEGFVPAKKEKEYLKKISLVSGQKNQLLWDLTAMDTYLLHKKIYKIDNCSFDEKIQNLSKTLKVEEYLNYPVRKLSLGQKMKLEIILALLHQPSILFLDEPTIGLDIVTQESLLTFLKEYQEKYNATIILTSHNMDDVERLCDRIIFLENGKKIFDGTKADCFQNVSSIKMKINELFFEKQNRDLEG